MTLETAPSLAAQLQSRPKLAHAAKAKKAFAELQAAHPPLSDLFTNHPHAASLITALADHSPFLWRLCLADPARLHEILLRPLAQTQAQILAIREAWRSAQSEAELMRLLRRAKQLSALTLALADLGGVLAVEQITQSLSDFADAAVAAALDFLLLRASQAGQLSLDPASPETGCGLVVLALGKHGAGELNYSSDIDLVVLFDPESPALRREPAPTYVKLTQALARLLQERTADGYVLRVDYRLRPDPGSTNVAVSLPSAFHYYEMLGQNWERAAFIKARPIAGERALGDEFLAALVPFIWRKYFDYAAIADIHAMKRQIHIVKGHAEIAVAGHDIKLGRGGIREVEFFVQTQQLIYGGRRPTLRGRRTLDMLAELQNGQWIDARARDELSEAYRFLRMIEHRLQMLADEQTQRLPLAPDALASFARFCGFASLAAFSKALTGHLRRVQDHYSHLFEDAPGLDAGEGSLVFTGATDDPATLETLARLGFANPKMTAETVRGWHFGRRSAVQSARAREVLTELVPSLLKSFAGSADPDAALAAFDQALGRMVAAVELFSILKSNGAIRDLFAQILGSAPRMAQMIATSPHVLDVAIDADSQHLSAQSRAARVSAALASAPTTEDFLDRARSMALEEGFLIGLHMLAGTFDAQRAGEAYSDLAQAVVAATFARVSADFQRDHGTVPGAGCAVLAFGKLGSREMTAVSDLDLVLLYDYDENQSESDGARPLNVSVYYTRLTQRLVSALTVPTRRGTLYEVDMRLRPSGKKGPLATQLRGFLDYQLTEAETWEHMSLTRARVIAGDEAVMQRARETIATILSKPRKADQILSDAAKMRSLIAQEKGESDEFDLKLASGGLMDIEFIAQTLLLIHAHDHPALLAQATRSILLEARMAGILDDNTAEQLLDAHALYTSVSQMQRLAIPGKFSPENAGKGVLNRLAQAANLPDFRALQRSLQETRRTIRAIFTRLMARP